MKTLSNRRFSQSDDPAFFRSGSASLRYRFWAADRVRCSRLVFILMLVMACFSPQPASVSAATGWYVSADGNNSHACTSPQAPCATVNGVLRKAGFTPGETIRVSGDWVPTEPMPPWVRCEGSESPMLLLDKDVVVSGGWNRSFTERTGRSKINGEYVVDLPYEDIRDYCTCTTVAPDVTASVEGFDYESCYIDNAGALTLKDYALDHFQNRGDASLEDGHLYYNPHTDNASQGIHNLGTMIVRGLSNEASPISNSGVLTITGTTVAPAGVTWECSNCKLLNSQQGVASISDSAFSRPYSLDNRGRLELVRNYLTGANITNAGTLTVTQSFVTESPGPGLSNSATLSVDNSTIANNAGAGIRSTGTLSINSGTIRGNAGAGVDASGQAVIQNSLLAGNKGADCKGNLASGGYNLFGEVTACNISGSTGDLFATDPHLGPLMGPPGAPKYYPLLPGSPAIDAGNPAGCTDVAGSPLAIDQRGAVRSGRCDMGAYEYRTPGLPASIQAFAGAAQHTLPGTPFGQPMQALVLDSAGSPVPGVLVTFTAPAANPTGFFADTGAVVTKARTGEDGVAAAARFTASRHVGEYVVLASAEGLIEPASFAMTNALWFVAPNGKDGNDCRDPARACATVERVLAQPGFWPGDTVRVGAGVYAKSSLHLDTSAILSGGWDGGFAVQDGMSTVDGRGGVGGIDVSCGVTSTIERFEVRGIGSGYYGAAIRVWECYYSPAGAVLTLVSSRVTANQLVGIENRGGVVTLANSTVSDNAGDADGGGIRNYGSLFVRNSSLTGNRARGMGGGIYNEGALAIDNSTVSGNVSASHGGGVYSKTTGSVTLSSSTIHGNSAVAGGGGIENASGDVTLQNTILAGNEAAQAPDCAGAIASAGYNLVGTAAGCSIALAAGDLTGIDPQMGALVGKPGRPPYHPLPAGSPAVDAGNPAGCRDAAGETITWDQRGASRGNRCDIGAYEYKFPGAAAFIYPFGGSPQHTPPGGSFRQPLQAAVLDAMGSPVKDRVVSFGAPASGPSGIFADTGTVATSARTDAGGIATAAALTSNGVPGAFRAKAITSGVQSQAVFELGSTEAWYVAPGGEDNVACVVPKSPCATIDGVLRQPLFIDGDEIRVAAGTYRRGEGDELLLYRSATLAGGWDTSFQAQTGTSVVEKPGWNVPGIKVGPNAGATIDRFTVHSGYTGILNLGTLTLRNSVVEGATEGGIRNEGRLIVEDSRIADNDGGYEGAGVRNSVQATGILRRTSIVNNRGHFDSTDYEHPAVAFWSGGIYNEGDLLVEDCDLSGNSGGGWSGGGDFPGAIWNDGTLSLRNSTVNGNSGGAIMNRKLLTIEDSLIDGNSGGAIASSGVLTITDTTITGNEGGAAGGVENHGTAFVSGSVVSGNRSGWNAAGGIRNEESGKLTLTASVVSDNLGDGNGGGIMNKGALTLRASSVTGNRSRKNGGGISLEWGSLTLDNSTVSGNTARDKGGGIATAERGRLTLWSSTVGKNAAGEAGGGIDNSSGTVNLKNSILAGNTAAGGQDCAGSVNAQGYNLIGTDAGCSLALSTGDQVNVEALIGPVMGLPDKQRYNPLLPGSPAIDGGDPAGCRDSAGEAITVDQRGAARNGHCDVGAYEYAPPGSAVVLYALDGLRQHAQPGAAFSQSLRVAVLDAAGSPVPGVTVAFAAPDNGATAVFADTGGPSTETQTDVSGVGAASPLVAGAVRGVFAVTATAAGIPDASLFELGVLDSWYVSPGGDDRRLCLVPEFPCATVHGALGQAAFLADDNIRVAAGTYAPDPGGAIILDQNVGLAGGWDPTFTGQTGTTVLRGQWIVVEKDVRASIDHLALENAGIQNSSGNLRLRNSTITGARNVALDNSGEATVENCVIANTDAMFNDGAVTNRGTMALRHTSIISNTAASGQAQEGDWGGRTGAGGIMNYGLLVAEDCTIAGNAGGRWSFGADLPGGIMNVGTLFLRHSAVISNTARTLDDIYDTNVAALLNRGNLTIEDSVIAGNRGGTSTAGIGSNGTMTITKSLVADNRGGGAGGINNYGTATIRNTAIVGNSGVWWAGGITTGSGCYTELINTTVSGNSSRDGPGGVGSDSGTVKLASSTVSGNDGVGIGNANADWSSVTLRNSLVAGNGGDGSVDCVGKIASDGYNLMGNIEGCDFSPVQGDLVGVDAGLGPLSGTPPYRPLMPGSPAINAGDPAGCSDPSNDPLPADQRGAPRVGRCDIGAYEAGLYATKHVTRRGSQLTYRISLANLGGGVNLDPVVLTDTLPLSLTYVPGSLTATNGMASVEAGSLTWHGTVYSDTSTLLTFGVTFDGMLPAGTWITNTVSSSWADVPVAAAAGFQVREPIEPLPPLPRSTPPSALTPPVAVTATPQPVETPTAPRGSPRPELRIWLPVMCR